MSLFDHEKLDVYRVSLEFAAWADHLLENLNGKHANARDQLVRASQSIPLNIAEGNGKRTGKDRRRFFEIARGSAMECAASLDLFVVLKACEPARLSAGRNCCIELFRC